MKSDKKIAVSFALIASTGMAMAADSVWESQSELGIVSTSGNSKTSTINAKINTTLEEGSWRHTLHVEFLKSSNSGTTSAEKYQTSGQSDYKFNETDYAFGRIDYENDKFSGFDYQITTSGGYGKRVLDKNKMILDLEVGPGIRFYKDSVIRQSENDPLLRLAAKYSWAVSSNATFTEDLSSDIGSDITVSKSVTGLQANINASLAMKITFTAKNTSNVPVGNKKTDTETAVTLVYAF